MYGQPPHGGGAWRIPPPQQHPQPPYGGFQNPNFVPYPFYPNPNFPIQNPNFVNYPIQQNPNPNFQFHQPPPQQRVDAQQNPNFQLKQPQWGVIKEVIERVDKAPHGYRREERDQLHVGTSGRTDAQRETGRLGDFFAFKYFLEKFGEPFVIWVNETNETELPYDLVVGDDEYVEIKATISSTKDWFHITSREWQFARERDEQGEKI
ncbi:hypothetical protein K7X08_023635 [Anisodus acutangulus]|uniref:Protein NO VEIN C-terminal domain-containing protein n=1 Tax=Anisodus acutangulus TaxID=402998 RepID=A0A9Q1QWS6_9SOLA|nr:hypothetical protein K7X08_023635 [Anisodus acutangulus]